MGDVKLAVEWMEAGDKVKHSNWQDDSFVWYDKDTYEFRNSTGRVFEFGLGDFKAEWEIYKEKTLTLSKMKMELRNLAFNFFRDELAYNPYLNDMEKTFAKCVEDVVGGKDGE